MQLFRTADTAQRYIAAGKPDAGVTGGITSRTARSTP